MHKCDVKCLAVTAANIKETPWEITARCTTIDGKPGLTGHGTDCYLRSDITFVTPCDVMKDLYSADY